MPHHSAQKRQINSSYPGDPSPNMMLGAGGPPPGGMPPRPFVPTSRGADFGRMPQGVVVQGQHPGMRGPGPHHVAMTSSWMPSTPCQPHQQQQQQQTHLRVNGGGIVHRVDLHRDAGTIAEQSTHDEDVTTPMRSLASKGGSSSFDSSHEAAASVLLLAAGAMKERTTARAPPSTRDAGSHSASVDETDRTVPLKKRKNAAADIMRKKSAEHSIPCHVSPHSEMSKNDSSTNGGDSSAANTPTQPVRTRRGTPGGSPSSSYDLKDGQALPDSAKITDTKDISPPTHVEIPHFPSVLHAVLTESEFAGKVLNWLPHGQSWKIVRWDALRRQVLPKYFSQLREEDSKDGSGSIDAFLFHLSAWGFEEVTDGPDAGAYSHVLFRRELPQLCREMRFAPTQKEESVHVGGKYDAGARSILQVPSLNSTAGFSEFCSRSHIDDEKKVDYSPRSKSVGQTSPGWPNHEMVSTSSGPGPTMPYRPDNAGSTDAWKFFSKSPQWVGTPPATQQRTMPPYSPIRVRSGRGACRLPLHRNIMSKQSDASVSSASSRPSFPVSNRGKGNAGLRRPASILKSESVTSIGSHHSNMTATSNSTTAAKPADSNARMLERQSSSSSDAPTKSAASATAAAATVATTTKSTIPKTHVRPILKKRKLPMMTRKPSTSEDSTDTAESSAAASSSSYVRQHEQV